MHSSDEPREGAGSKWLYAQAHGYPLLTVDEERAVDTAKWRAVDALQALMVRDRTGRPLIRKWARNLLELPPQPERFDNRERYNLLKREQAHLLPTGSAHDELIALDRQLARRPAGAADEAALLELGLKGPLVAGLAELVLGDPEPAGIGAALDHWRAHWRHAGTGRPEAALPDRTPGIRTCLASYRDARATLVNHNLRLVYAIAGRFSGHGIPYDDLVQGAMPGLIRAAEKFDHARGYRFSTYAYNWIKQAIQQQVEDAQGILRYPAHTHENISRLYRERLRHYNATGHEPSTDYLARRLDMEPAKLEVLKAVTNLAEPIEHRVGDTDEGVALADTLAQSTFDPPTRYSELRSLNHRLRQQLASLPLPEKQVILLRWGLEGRPALTRTQVADRMDVSTERIRQLENAALARLRSDATLDEVYRDYLHAQ